MEEIIRAPLISGMGKTLISCISEPIKAYSGKTRYGKFWAF